MSLQVCGWHRDRKQFQLNTEVWVWSHPTSERSSIPFPRYTHNNKTEYDFRKEILWSDISKNRLSCTVRLILQVILSKNRPLRQEGTIWPICKTANYFFFFFTWHLGVVHLKLYMNLKAIQNILLLREICPTKCLNHNTSVPLRIRLDATDLELYKP